MIKIQVALNVISVHVVVDSMPMKDVPYRKNVHGDLTKAENRSLRDTELKVMDIRVGTCSMDPTCSSCKVGREPL